LESIPGPHKHLKVRALIDDDDQGVKRRCRLSLLTTSALVFQDQMRGRGIAITLRSQPMSAAVHIGFPRKDHFFPRNNENRSDSIPRKF
jgi:hypothetical protein